MKNRSSAIVIGLVFLFSVLGCSGLNPFSDKGSSSGSSEETVSDKAVDTVVGEEKIGIPECDAVMDELVAQTKSEKDDEGYVAKAFRQYWENLIRESIRKSIESNKDDPQKLAEECRKIKVQLDKYKAEEESKKKGN